jgi:hypothetical protein
MPAVKAFFSFASDFYHIDSEALVLNWAMVRNVTVIDAGTWRKSINFSSITSVANF